MTAEPSFEDLMLLPGATLDNVNTSGFHGPEADPDPERCRLCRGRGLIESTAGYDVTCFICDGSGAEPDPDEDPHDPRICVDCDHSHGAPCPVNPDGICLYPDCPCVEFVDPTRYLEEHLQ